jgi:hypothetical protein
MSVASVGAGLLAGDQRKALRADGRSWVKTLREDPPECPGRGVTQVVRIHQVVQQGNQGAGVQERHQSADAGEHERAAGRPDEGGTVEDRSVDEVGVADEQRWMTTAPQEPGAPALPGRASR